MLNKDSKEKYLVFVVNGGAGKNVLATAVVKAIKDAKPDTDISVITAYKEVWMYNPSVYRTYLHTNTPNFYKDFIQDNPNVTICAQEPYLSNDYILKKKHLIEVWCDLVEVKYKGQQPELFFNQRELEYGENLRDLKNEGAPIFLIQTNGGAQQDVKVSWMRDLPMSVAQEVVFKLKDRYRVIHIRRDDQPGMPFPFVEQFKGSLRELMILIKYSKKRLFIDSVCQHIAAALEKKSTVTWVRNDPKMLGYKIHDNIVTKVEDEIDVLSESFLEPYDISGNIYQCPFKEGTQLFDADEILKTIID